MSTSRTELACAVVVVLAGCNDLLGLDATTTDSDGDGIVDSLDNCPDVFNPVQLDSNHDGVGNACQCITTGQDRDGDGIDDGCDDCIGPGPTHVDSGGDGIDDGCEPCPAATGTDIDGDGVDDACDDCLLGPPHDEDGDGVADACDNCPTVANPDQAASGDADIVGDACDAAPGIQTAMRMDGFGSVDGTLWNLGVPNWHWTDDQLLGDGPTLRYAAISVSDQCVVETRVTVDPNGGHAKLHVYSYRAPVTCELDAQRMVTLSLLAYPLAYANPAGPVPGTGPIRLRLTSATNTLHCEAMDVDTGQAVTATIANASASARGRVGLESVAGVTHFDYLWAAWTPPAVAIEN